LAQHGENYELISLVLPGRSRTACKNKFKAEDKKDSARITRCLDSRTPIGKFLVFGFSSRLIFQYRHENIDSAYWTRLFWANPDH
jgi:hypothetical protein